MHTKILLFVVFIFAFALQAHGWWATGHMLVSQIALKHLTADSQVSQEQLHAFENAITSLVTYSSASNTFVTAACWMDDIKTRNLTQFDNWHFINLPICDFPDSNNTDACNGISVDSILSSDEEDVIWAISLATATVMGDFSLGFERGFAIRNLLHLVGDLHQPLHTVARYCNETPNGDEGGNLFPIANISYANNLHSLWDSGVGMLDNTINRPLNQTATTYLSNLADQLIARTANLTRNEVTINVTQWALDSRQWAINTSYNLAWNSTPSAEYMAQAWEVIQNQIGLGGYRLHLILKEMLVCDTKTGNCPESEQTVEKRETVWFIIGIVLAAALGVSLIMNIILYHRKRLFSSLP
eukprot:Phypoly_transcript_02105.p2 GENE.Phypoly_transcript_02105~~Phypoly_transcript_02105.p2  ORF type:complete len:356 (+),score=32.86 Phypoly_transcript_02105:149-1216(+)